MLKFIWILVSAFCVLSKCDSHKISIDDDANILLGTPCHTHVFRESNTHLSIRRDIKKQNRARSDHPHEVIFVIQQRNMEELTSILYDISDPNSSNYGQHWSREDVVDFTSNPGGRDAVVSYLNSNGAFIVSETLAGEYVTAVAPINVWEKIFKTEFYSFIVTRYDESVHTVIRAEDYWIPRELDKHVTSVLNTIELLTPSPTSASRVPVASKIGKFSSTALGYMTPTTLKAYYNMSNVIGSINSTQMIYASLGQYYSPRNLASLQEYDGLPIQPPVRDHGNHSSDTVCEQNYGSCAEANLDIQYIMTMSPSSPTTFWYTDNWFNDFLIEVSNIVSTPKVISISYGQAEVSVDAGVWKSFDDAAIKLSVMGTTIVAASGDDGANSWSARSDTRFCGYSNLFPATSQYVLSVGGTTVSQIWYRIDLKLLTYLSTLLSDK